VADSKLKYVEMAVPPSQSKIKSRILSVVHLMTSKTSFIMVYYFWFCCISQL